MRRLLYVVHAWHNRGGTENHTRSLVRGLHRDFEISVLFPEQGRIWLRRPDGSELSWPADEQPWPLAPAHQPRSDAALRAALEVVQPDVIHIQHFIYWPLGVIDLLTATGVPTVLTFHDYYAITPLFTMEGVQTPTECFTPAYAQRCFGRDLSRYLGQRRDLLAAAFTRCRKLVTPSQTLAATLAEVFPIACAVIAHGIPGFPRSRATREPVAPLHFGYLGSLLPQKGWETLIAGFEESGLAAAGHELHLFGGRCGQTPAGVTCHGVYESTDLPAITARCDVGIIPSLFRETFSLVLSEWWQGGVPVAAVRSGVFPERIVDGVNGRLFTPGDPGAVAAVLRWFAADGGWRQWAIPQPRLEEEMWAEYRQMYEVLC